VYATYGSYTPPNRLGWYFSNHVSIYSGKKIYKIATKETKYIVLHVRVPYPGPSLGRWPVQVALSKVLTKATQIKEHTNKRFLILPPWVPLINCVYPHS
jgi:hypothetical protein